MFLGLWVDPNIFWVNPNISYYQGKSPHPTQTHYLKFINIGLGIKPGQGAPSVAGVAVYSLKDELGGPTCSKS